MPRTTNPDVHSSMVSRRGIIMCSAGVAAGLLPVRAHSQSKIAKPVAGYQDSPNNGQSCSGCGHFIAPASCALVDGAISPGGWCKLFVQKG